MSPSTALAPIDLPTSAGRIAPRGGRAIAVAPSGYIVADLVQLAREDYFATYEVRIDNATTGELAAYACGLLADGTRVTDVAERVLPNAALRRSFNLPLGGGLHYERVTLEIHGTDVSISVDALPPAPAASLKAIVGPAVRPRRALVAVSALLAVGGILALWTTRPRVDELTLLRAGSGAVNVRYATSGWGERSYRLTGEGGHEFASGTLRDRAATIRLTKHEAAATVRVAVHGIFSSAVREAMILPVNSIGVVRLPAPRPAIRSLRLVAGNGANDASLHVAYATDGERARLLVRDAAGATTLVVNMPAGGGQVSIPATAIPRNGPFRIIVEARRGAVTANSELSVSDASMIAGRPAAAETTPSLQHPIVVRPRVPVEGATIAVGRYPVDGTATVAITRLDGSPVVQAALGPGETEARFIAPAAGQYSLNVTVTRGTSTETSLSAVTVARSAGL